MFVCVCLVGVGVGVDECVIVLCAFPKIQVNIIFEISKKIKIIILETSLLFKYYAKIGFSYKI